MYFYNSQPVYGSNDDIDSGSNELAKIEHGRISVNINLDRFPSIQGREKINKQNAFNASVIMYITMRRAEITHPKPKEAIIPVKV